MGVDSKNELLRRSAALDDDNISARVQSKRAKIRPESRPLRRAQVPALTGEARCGRDESGSRERRAGREPGGDTDGPRGRLTVTSVG